MVVLLIGMAVAAVWMSAALPAWRQQVIREKEAELVFRGEQYARAIVLYQQKNNGALPSNIDLLVSQHYLRKKYKDPITNDDFVPVGGGLPGQTSQQVNGVPNQGRGGGSANVQLGGITGVRSKSTATSIRVYQNQQVYSQWPFDASAMLARMGRTAALPGGGRGGQPGRGGAFDRGGAGGPGGRAGGRGGGDARGAGPGGRGGPPAGRGGGLPVGPGGARGGGS